MSVSGAAGHDQTIAQLQLGVQPPVREAKNTTSLTPQNAGRDALFRLTNVGISAGGQLSLPM